MNRSEVKGKLAALVRSFSELELERILKGTHEEDSIGKAIEDYNNKIKIS